MPISLDPHQLSRPHCRSLRSRERRYMPRVVLTFILFACASHGAVAIDANAGTPTSELSRCLDASTIVGAGGDVSDQELKAAQTACAQLKQPQPTRIRSHGSRLRPKTSTTNSNGAGRRFARRKLTSPTSSRHDPGYGAQHAISPKRYSCCESHQLKSGGFAASA